MSSFLAIIALATGLSSLSGCSSTEAAMPTMKDHPMNGAHGLAEHVNTMPMAELTSRPFQGVKANRGTVRYVESGRMAKLVLSADFVIPDTPAPHWQLVDSGGRTYLLQQMKIKDGATNREIAVPNSVMDIAKVQVWCAFAETLLGETTFDRTITLPSGRAMTSTRFVGPKANTGTVQMKFENGRRMLTLSSDFVTPDTPAPHWQVVDSHGTVHLLQRLVIKDNLHHLTIAVPDYVHDVAKVQIWCSFAEVLLGEAVFAKHEG